MRCDVCGKECALASASTLLEGLQSPGVRDICDACTKWATTLKWKHINEATDKTRAAIAERAATTTAATLRALRDSSAGERVVHTHEVAGANPAPASPWWRPFAHGARVGVITPIVLFAWCVCALLVAGIWLAAGGHK